LAHASATWSAPFDLAAVAALAAVGASTRQPRRRRALFAGATVLALATAPFVHPVTDRSLTAHVAQHLALVVIGAPLAAYGLMGSSLLRRRGARSVGGLVRPPWAPPVSAVVHTAVMAVWHLPGWYDGAIAAGWLHGLEHLTLVATAAWWWSAVAHHAVRSQLIAALASLVVAAGGGAALGVALMFADRPLYASGPDVADQQAAGALLAASGVVYGAVAGVLTGRAVHRASHPRPARIPSGVTTAVAAVALAAGVVAIGVHAQPDRRVAATAAPDQGAELYRRDCAWCHGPTGEGTSRGIPIGERGTASVYYALATGRMPIDEPGAPVERSDPHYTSDEVASIVEHTAGFVTGPDVPDLGVTAVPLPRGAELYLLHCAACHGATGIGGAQAYGRAAPSLHHADRLDTAAAIVAGPGGMPSFRAALDDDEVAAVAAYVDYLDSPRTTGIAIPGGRVGEGLVGWLVGVGALVGLAAWLARTR
jgi:ubiquinol-cytochrome c reductase cytochrome c subunit